MLLSILQVRWSNGATERRPAIPDAPRDRGVHLCPRPKSDVSGEADLLFHKDAERQGMFSPHYSGTVLRTKRSDNTNSADGYLGDLEAAESAHLRAFECGSNHADTLALLAGSKALIAGEPAEAIPLIERAMRSTRSRPGISSCRAESCSRPAGTGKP